MGLAPVLFYDIRFFMNTQTHVIIGAALFGKAIPQRSWIAACGGLLPDIPMLLIVFALKLYSVPDFLIFNVLYWQNWWQITNGIAHNFWVWGGALLFGLLMRERRSISADAISGWGTFMAFSASGLLHVLIDLLCHREDAHMSFWPISRWKFMSPVSYYDPLHYGHYFGLFEASLGFLLAIVLWRRFPNRWLRVILVSVMLIYVALPAYFILL